MSKPKAGQGSAVDTRVKAPGPSAPGARKRADKPHDLSLALPHEREQAETHYDEAEPAPKMKQAHRDLQKGLTDTEARSDALRAFDRAYPGGARPATPARRGPKAAQPRRASSTAGASSTKARDSKSKERK